jgi:hypothetical protein
LISTVDGTFILRPNRNALTIGSPPLPQPAGRASAAPEPAARTTLGSHRKRSSGGPCLARSRQRPGFSSVRKGRLLLLRRLLGVLLAVALVLLRGGLDLGRRRGLRGFVGALLLKYFRILSECNILLAIYNNDCRIYLFVTVLLSDRAGLRPVAVTPDPSIERIFPQRALPSLERRSFKRWTPDGGGE